MLKNLNYNSSMFIEKLKDDHHIYIKVIIFWQEVYRLERDSMYKEKYLLYNIYSIYKEKEREKKF